MEAALLLLCAVAAGLASSADHGDYSKVIDQRQSGDYNIHIDLKDVQIIALLGGRGGDSDYDYNYDYADMTIKPQNGSSTTPANTTDDETTLAPASSTTPTATTELVVEITPSKIPLVVEMNATSADSNTHLAESTTAAVTPISITTNSTANEETTIKTPTGKPTVANTTQEIPPSLPNNTNTELLQPLPAQTVSNLTQQNYNKTQFPLQGDQIPVQIVVTPVHVPTTEKHYRVENRAETVTRIRNHPLYAECPVGFVRDQHGRCYPKAKNGASQNGQQITLQKLVELSQKLKLARKEG